MKEEGLETNRVVLYFLSHGRKPRSGSAYNFKFDKNLYAKWAKIFLICYNTAEVDFKNYGGKGICVCDEWINSFEVFRDWCIENGYKEFKNKNDKPQYLLRKDTTKDYSPDNCFISSIPNQHEYRPEYEKATLFTYNNVTKSGREWAKVFGMTNSSLYARLRRAHFKCKDVFDKIIEDKKSKGEEVFIPMDSILSVRKFKKITEQVKKENPLREEIAYDILFKYFNQDKFNDKLDLITKKSYEVADKILEVINQ